MSRCATDASLSSSDGLKCLGFAQLTSCMVAWCVYGITPLARSVGTTRLPLASVHCIEFSSRKRRERNIHLESLILDNLTILRSRLEMCSGFVVLAVFRDEWNMGSVEHWTRRRENDEGTYTKLLEMGQPKTPRLRTQHTALESRRGHPAGAFRCTSPFSLVIALLAPLWTGCLPTHRQLHPSLRLAIDQTLEMTTSLHKSRTGAEVHQAPSGAIIDDSFSGRPPALAPPFQDFGARSN
ncbi:hypothetical protein CABS01_05370 [Colletotrichum abscissum]|uniref:uncharacterized protein n=1 Tax=Colletotrichum abscissum TaxID=1671311 RepID=UPI0027D7597D|nr:uncharacterized protein CABS01_05370 [Colletotrichum abscissum]KAK1520865.1 hypothetical protein CABS01_05370 [Colletotrichum abscissum]